LLKNTIAHLLYSPNCYVWMNIFSPLLSGKMSQELLSFVPSLSVSWSELFTGVKTANLKENLCCRKDTMLTAAHGLLFCSDCYAGCLLFAVVKSVHSVCISLPLQKCVSLLAHDHSCIRVDSSYCIPVWEDMAWQMKFWHHDMCSFVTVIHTISLLKLQAVQVYYFLQHTYYDCQHYCSRSLR